MNYFIEGDAAKADRINAAFEKLGYDTSRHLFNAKSVLYFTLDGEIRATTCKYTPAIIKTHPDYRELELQVEPCFKVGDRIKNCVQQRKIGKVDEKQQVYLLDNGIELEFSEQDQWEVVEPQAKFGEGQLVVYNGLIGKVKYFQYFKAEGCYRYVIGDDVVADEDQLTLADHRDIARITGKG